mmetsp:Transcript_29289/g.93978  ORF Transcript_29289/g.93978 Transcript_29289/m.93978 type:complete len:204 (-) Transcript_29289:103-714(-)
MSARKLPRPTTSSNGSCRQALLPQLREEAILLLFQSNLDLLEGRMLPPPGSSRSLHRLLIGQASSHASSHSLSGASSRIVRFTSSSLTGGAPIAPVTVLGSPCALAPPALASIDRRLLGSPSEFLQTTVQCSTDPAKGGGSTLHSILVRVHAKRHSPEASPQLLGPNCSTTAIGSQAEHLEGARSSKHSAHGSLVIIGHGGAI